MITEGTLKLSPTLRVRISVFLFYLCFGFFATFLRQSGTNELTHDDLELFLLIISY